MLYVLGIRNRLRSSVFLLNMAQSFFVCLPSGCSFITQALTNQKGITGYTDLLGNFPAKHFKRFALRCLLSQACNS